MMRPELEIARQLIEDKQFDKARMVLQKASDDPIAQKWLDKLDEMSPAAKPIQHLNGNGHSNGNGQTVGWQYAALEMKRSYGTQYRFNGSAMPDWKDQPIYYALNELGRDGWELVSFDGRDETTVYILKKQGAVLENKKVEVWDQ
ncbi:MAG: hypothetical protein DWB42_03790 [Chloroflexi bacterium]|nr:hypothetical protein [Chloroflexota bacterium]MDL1882100.1 hypothetical protein [Anaerolineae bacterium CFX8]